jgi:glucosamine--fructose-6-phosphate aminotransferase (isomerizing)
MPAPSPDGLNHESSVSAAPPRPSRLEAEIREQPSVLAAAATARKGATALAGAMLRSAGVTHLVIAARGSSANAARYAQYLFGTELGMSVHLAAPSLFSGGIVPRLDGAAVMAISQSGQSPDVVAVLASARAQGRPTIAVTNDTSSPVTGPADVVVPLLAGPELSVAATKTYTATVQALVQIAIAAGAGGLQPELDRLPGLLADILAASFDEAGVLTTFARRLAGRPGSRGDSPALTVVGRGTGAAGAAEVALKIREVALSRTEAYSAPDLLHGPIAALGPSSLVCVVASPSYPLAYWRALCAQLRAAGVTTGVVASAPMYRAQPEFLSIPGDLPAWLFDVLVVGYGQCAALQLGRLAGLDVDRPRGLSKVTLTC